VYSENRHFEIYGRGEYSLLERPNGYGFSSGRMHGYDDYIVQPLPGAENRNGSDPCH
jgi:hypothetical protein